MLPVIVHHRVVYISEQAGLLGGEEAPLDLVKHLLQVPVTLVEFLWVVPLEYM